MRNPRPLGIALPRFCADHTPLMHFSRDLSPSAEHFSSMGNWFLAMVCVGILVFVMLFAIAML